MEHVTLGKEFPEGKIVSVECERNSSLENINIKGECFLLIVLLGGSATFKLGEKKISAKAPCFICFDETENPVLISKSKCRNLAIYFHPQYLNINMTFELIRSETYGAIAHVHDMFLLKPFIEGKNVIPIGDSHREKIETACEGMEFELREQRDWYWSCRGRSYFMEIIISLERMYALWLDSERAPACPIKNPMLKKAVLFIEGNYSGPLTLADLVAESGLNHTTLTALFREETGMTAIEYLMFYRIKVAKKQLAFTFIPIKDISARCGFKTVQHFSKVFKKHTGDTPDNYRHNALHKRMAELG